MGSSPGSSRGRTSLALREQSVQNESRRTERRITKSSVDVTVVFTARSTGVRNERE